MSLFTYVCLGLLIIACLVIAVLAIRISILKSRLSKDPIGVLKIDSSDIVDGPLLFLELNRDVDTVKLMHDKEIMLKVDATDFVSHK